MAKNLVFKSTTDDEEPPSGPMLKELEVLCKGSVHDQEIVVDALLQRLKKPSALVKWKALKVIKHLAMNGNSNIARTFQRQHENIRDCVNFTGAQHPLYGDELNERVRKEAKDTIAVVFAAPTSTSSSNFELESKIKGYEGNSSGYGDSSGSSRNIYSGSSGRMPGMGNSSYQPNSGSDFGSGNSSSGSSVLDKVKDTFGSIVGSKKNEELQYEPNYNPPSQPYMGPQPTSGIGSSGFGNYNYSGNSGSHTSSPSPSPSQPAAHADTGRGRQPKAAKTKRKKGQVAGMWKDDDGSENQPTLRQPTEAPQRFAAPPRPAAGLQEASPIAYSSPSTEAAKSSFSNTPKGNRGRGTSAIEKALVNDLCAAVGVKSVPPKDKLDKIVASWGALDQWYIAEQLDEKLDEGEKWQVNKKALIVLETLAKVDATMLKEYFQENPDNLITLLSSSQQSVSSKAKKLIQVFDVEADLPDTITSGRTEDDGSEPTDEVASSPFSASPSPSPARPVQATQAVPDAINMFGNLTMADASPAPIAQAAKPAAVAKPVAAPANTGDDLLSFLGDAPTAKPAAAPQRTSGASGFDFLHSGSSELPAGPRLSGTSDSAFGFMESGSSSNGALNFGSLPAAPAGPAFGQPAPVSANLAFGQPAFGNGFGQPAPFNFGAQPAMYGAPQPMMFGAPQPMMFPPAGNAGFGFGNPAAAPPAFIVQAAPASGVSAASGARNTASSNDQFSFLVSDMMSTGRNN